MIKLNLLVLLFLAITANAQTISGKILSENQPVSYAKIGVEGEKIGAIADKEGGFKLDLDNIDRSKFVKIEAAGFEPYQISVDDFVKANPQNIQIKEKIRTIAEVKINPKKLAEKNWGINTKGKSLMYNVDPEKGMNFLAEFALGFSTKKPAKIQKINLNVARINSAEPIIINYVIYSSKNGLPNEVLSDYRISATLSQDKIADGIFSVDVSKENIWVNGDFFVSMQVMTPFHGNLKISGAPFRTGFMREYFGYWEKVSVLAPAININVKVDKNYKNEDDELRKTKMVTDEKKFVENYVHNDRLNSDAQKLIFGNNDVAGNYFKTNNLEMYYETYGSGEPLFLLHGNGGSIRAFYKQIDEFSKNFQVIAVDTRAQGKSKDYTTADFTYELFADDLKNLADHLNIKKANIIGWSDGGIIALIYAMKFPENVDKLIAVGANINPNGVSKADISRMQGDLEFLQNANPKNDNAIRLTKLMLNEPHISVADLSKIKTPTLIVAGEHDMILPEHTAEIAKSIPGAQLKIVKGASHSLIQEKPVEFNAFALQFLKTGKP